MIGIILVEGRTRCVDRKTALAISKTVHETTRPGSEDSEKPSAVASSGAVDFFEHTSTFLQNKGRALLVGVFQNQSLEYVLQQQSLLNLDIVQLHGSEPIEWASLIPVPVIHRFGPGDPGLRKRGYHALPLIDAAKGGTGEGQDLVEVQKLLASDDGLRIILAGGLNPANVGKIVKQFQDIGAGRLVAVDVSSGVEEDGTQSLEKIKKFIAAAKNITQT